MVKDLKQKVGVLPNSIHQFRRSFQKADTTSAASQRTVVGGAAGSSLTIMQQ